MAEYHARSPAGKLRWFPSSPAHLSEICHWHIRQVRAVPCLEIHENPKKAAHYTARGNLVAVVNGTAVGLGDIGPLASKPMEGKAVLFKRFAGIDV